MTTSTLTSNLPNAQLPTPDFNTLNDNQLAQTVNALIDQIRQSLSALSPPTQFDASYQVINQFDNFEVQLNEAFGLLSHLNAVMNSPERRDLYQQIVAQVSALYTELGQSHILFDHYRFLANDAKFAQLSDGFKGAVRHTLREFELSGVALPEQQKMQFAQHAAQLSQLAVDFSNHVMDATQAFVRPLDEHELDGLPASSRALLIQYGEQHHIDGAAATLDFPAYHAIMTHATNRSLREQLYYAYTTRASELGSASTDNSAIMQRILDLRLAQARLLGFAHYADLSLARKMAPSVVAVEQFLLDLAAKAREPAKQEMLQMQALASQDGIDQLQAWDTAYYAEQLRKQQFDLSQEALKPYFPIDKVISGLFEICEKLFAVRIVPKQASVWHPDVRYYEVLDIQTPSAQCDIIGGFYFDLYARPNKRGGAWMNGFRAKMRSDQHDQKPIAFMVANFTPPIAGHTAQLNHDEIVTLFHEFGHGLHHVLSEADHLTVSGTNGVAWDAVELPSQFLEFWAWQAQALDMISGHVEHGETLPKHLLTALLDAQTFQSGLQTLRQVEFALFDLKVHQMTPAPDAASIEHLLKDIRQQVALLPAPSFNRFAHSFSHIFAGGYAAGYYSYKWAEVLASDAFDRFETEGIFNATTGQDFRKAVLAVGGQVDALDAFKRFRGREPRIDALLRHQGWQSSHRTSTQQDRRAST